MMRLKTKTSSTGLRAMNPAAMAVTTVIVQINKAAELEHNRRIR
jgi:hypothetical protein